MGVSESNIQKMLKRRLVLFSSIFVICFQFCYTQTCRENNEQLRVKARELKDSCDRNARLVSDKESKRLLQEKTALLESDLIMNQALCRTFKEKYIPFGLELDMPLKLQEFCGKIEVESRSCNG